MPLVKTGWATVEIHTHLNFPNPSDVISMEKVWERAVPLRCGQSELLGLSAEDLLLHLCCHISYQHRFDLGLLHFCDIAWIAEDRAGTLDWLQFCERAWHSEMARGVQLVFRVAHALLGAECPEPVRKGLQPTDGEEQMVEIACAHVFNAAAGGGAVSGGMANLWRAGSLRAKAQAFLGSVFQPPHTMAHMYPVVPDSRWLYWYYLVRVKDMLKRHWRVFSCMKGGDRALLAKAKSKNQLFTWLEGGSGPV